MLTFKEWLAPIMDEAKAYVKGKQENDDRVLREILELRERRLGRYSFNHKQRPKTRHIISKPAPPALFF